jgi:hypothetical protein
VKKSHLHFIKKLITHAFSLLCIPKLKGKLTNSALKRLIVELAFCHIMNVTFFQVNLNYTNGELTLTVDYKFKTAQLFGLKFQLGDRVIIGSGGKSNQGICL